MMKSFINIPDLTIYAQPITEADRAELRWQDQERRRMERDNEACGFVEDENETETYF